MGMYFVGVGGSGGMISRLLLADEKDVTGRWGCWSTYTAFGHCQFV